MEGIIPVAIQALSLRCNTSTGIAHPVDASVAKELFVALVERNIPLDRDDIRRSAEACGWSARHAQTLGELAERIGKGDRVRIDFPRGWGEDTVARLMAAT